MSQFESFSTGVDGIPRRAGRPAQADEGTGWVAEVADHLAAA